MSRPLTDQLRAYFDDVDRQQGAVDIDGLRRSVEERVIMIELSPDKAVPPNGPTSGRRWPILIAAAAAFVLVVGALVVFDDDDAAPADQPSPAVTVPPTTPPRSLLGTLDGQLVPGTYFLDNVDGTPMPRIFVTVGEGWVKDYFFNGPIIYRAAKSGNLGELAGFMMFSQPAAVFRDACHPGVDHPSYRGPVTTLDSLVVALSEQKGWVDVTAPSDISIDGYAGKAFQRTAPADMSDCDTTPSYGPRVRTDSAPPVFLSWVSDTDPFSGGGPYEPGQIETLWILDLDGTLVVINTRPSPEASAAAHAAFAALLDSIRIERA